MEKCVFAISGAGNRSAASGVAWSGCASLRGPLCAGEALLELGRKRPSPFFIQTRGPLRPASATLRPEFGGDLEFTTQVFWRAFFQKGQWGGVRRRGGQGRVNDRRRIPSPIRGALCWRCPLRSRCHERRSLLVRPSGARGLHFTSSRCSTSQPHGRPRIRPIKAQP